MARLHNCNFKATFKAESETFGQHSTKDEKKRLKRTATGVAKLENERTIRESQQLEKFTVIIFTLILSY